MTEIILSVIAGLVLFLYAVNNLSEILNAAVGEKTKKWIATFTSNTFKSIITGIIATTLLDSSSAVIIITIVFVNSRVIKLRQAMGVVLGANIGTTISSQVIALNIGKFSPILLLAGFILLLLSKSHRVNNTGKALLYFGVLFFGLYTMENALLPLKQDAIFTDWLKKAEQPLTGSLMGTITTVIIQSSSATVGIAIILAKKGLLSLPGGMAIMFGAELGTCSDTLLASINGSRAALKTGLFHLLFNLVSIITGLLLFYPFVNLVTLLSKGATIERSIANAHMLFNVAGVLLFAGFLPFFETFLNKILPDKPKKAPLSSTQR